MSIMLPVTSKEMCNLAEKIVTQQEEGGAT